jgi:hypothetical protein
MPSLFINDNNLFLAVTATPTATMTSRGGDQGRGRSPQPTTVSLFLDLSNEPLLCFLYKTFTMRNANVTPLVAS